MVTEIKEFRVGEYVLAAILESDGWITGPQIHQTVQKFRPDTTYRRVSWALEHLRKAGIIRAWRPPANKNAGPGWESYRYKPRPFLLETSLGQMPPILFREPDPWGVNIIKEEMGLETYA